MKKEKKKEKKKKKGKKSDLEKVYDLTKKNKKPDLENFYDLPLNYAPGYHEFKNAVTLIKRTGKKKETCSKCIHFFKGRFCQNSGPSLHLAIQGRLLNCGLTEKEASDRSYYLPEVPASWHCKNWREKE